MCNCWTKCNAIIVCVFICASLHTFTFTILWCCYRAALLLKIILHVSAHKVWQESDADFYGWHERNLLFIFYWLVLHFPFEMSKISKTFRMLQIVLVYLHYPFCFQQCSNSEKSQILFLPEEHQLDFHCELFYNVDNNSHDPTLLTTSSDYGCFPNCILDSK